MPSRQHATLVEAAAVAAGVVATFGVVALSLFHVFGRLVVVGTALLTVVSVLTVTVRGSQPRS